MTDQQMAELLAEFAKAQRAMQGMVEDLINAFGDAIERHCGDDVALKIAAEMQGELTKIQERWVS